MGKATHPSKIFLFSCSRLQNFLKQTYFRQSGHMKRVLEFDFTQKIKILPDTKPPYIIDHVTKTNI